MSRSEALGRIALVYLFVQLMSYAVLQASCSPSVVHDVWLRGALGPIAAIEAVPSFRYHSLLSNAAFVGWCLLLLAAPFAYAVHPRRSMLVLSAIALVVWCVFGLGFTIRHI